MASKHVIAYFMHEWEEAFALEKMKNAEATESFVIGEIDEADVEAFRESGLILQDLPLDSPGTPIESDLTAVEPTTLSATWSMPIEDMLVPTRAIFDAAVPAPTDYYQVMLNGPLLETRRQQLNELGVELGDRVPGGGYMTKLSSDQILPINKLSFVESVNWISPEASVAQTAPSAMVRPIQDIYADEPEPLVFDLRLRSAVDIEAILNWLNERNIVVVGSTARKIRFQSRPNAPELDELAMMPEVDRIAEYQPPQLANDHARCLLGIDDPAGIANSPLSEDGTGQIVAVADSGFDDQHPDFQGRVVSVVARGRPGNHSDIDGHGTHVAGSVLGDGAASNGKIRGIAPKASLFFQSLLDANGKLGGLPIDLNDLFEEAYQVGARIHNNSWSTLTRSVYTMNSEEVDEFINNHKDMLVVVAAGNEGSGMQPKKADPGYVDWLSVGSPASCKNALTVGASRSSRNNGPLANLTWGSAWPQKFPLPPIANEKVVGDPESLAAFSGRGPCDDHRIKPDLVAPGTDILSARSSLAPTKPYSGSIHYSFNSGTSMAAPLVSGCAALVRQYFVENCAHNNPSAALLKATLVNSTKWLTGVDANAKDSGKPNYHQGHGRVCMALAIPNSSQPGMTLQFVDDWQTFQFTYTGQRKRYQFVLPADAPELRFCMAYTDHPARGLQNNLNLLVDHLETRTKYVGNATLPNALTLPDPDNNLEVVRIEKAKAGTYFIQVFAANLLRSPQDFALVVTGVGVPKLVQI